MLENWTKGYSQAELDAAQERFTIRFPPDLITLLLEKRPVKGHDWRNADAISKALAWPYDALKFDIENNGLWWDDWGPRPATSDGREAVLRGVLKVAPRQIPLLGHRYLPEAPHEAGNPVFSIYGADTMIYGTDLEDYFQREFSPAPQFPVKGAVKDIPFWSRLAQNN